jgi:hypothetical protein
VGEVQANQTRQFTSNMLEFLFKLDLIFSPREVQEHDWGKFRRTKRGSSARTCYNFYLKLDKFLPQWEVHVHAIKSSSTC